MKRHENYQRIMKALLVASDGTNVTVCFIKKDGTERTLNGRLKVRKGLKDPENPQVPTTAHIPKYVVLWDFNAPCGKCEGDEPEACPQCNGSGRGDYRNVNVETMQYMKVGGIRVAIAPGVEVPS